MTVNSSTATVSYTGNGVTTAFPVPFYFLLATDLKVTRKLVSGVITTLVLNSDYTVSGVGNPSGGTLTMLVAPASGDQLFVERDIDFVQQTAYPENNKFPSASHEKALDRDTMGLQQLGSRLDRALVAPPLATYFDAGNRTIAAMAPGISDTDASTVLQARQIAEQVAAGIPGGVGSFVQSGTGAVLRTFQDKMRDRASAKDFGAAGDNFADDGAKIAAGIAAKNGLVFPAGTYKNASTALNVPFAKIVEFDPDASIANSGSGSYVNTGFQIRKGWNPDGMTWTNFVDKKNYAGFHVDIGNYGATGFSNLGSVAGVIGATNVPAGALTGGWGIAGYSKTVAPAGPAVAMFGNAELLADNTVCWGLNTLSRDNGFHGAQVWGIEVDLNITNNSTPVVGVDVTGGSTVEPAVSVAYRVGPLGAFTAPKKKWSRGFYVDDGAAFTAIEIGALFDNGANVGAPPIDIYYRNASSARTKGVSMALDTAGIFSIDQANGSRIDISGRNAGVLTPIVSVAQNKLGFFSATPVVKPTITGSKGGNVALDSLLQELNRIGLITNSTT